MDSAKPNPCNNIVRMYATSVRCASPRRPKGDVGMIESMASSSALTAWLCVGEPEAYG